MLHFDLIRVTAVRHIRNHVLWLEFSDGLNGEIDLENELIGEVFEPLKDRYLFAQVRLDAGTIAWPNGADWAPETLHDRVRAANRTAQHGNDDDPFGIARDVAAMPEISRFFGIVIRMFYADHARPHFHAQYGEHSIAVEITGDGLSGSFPPHRMPLLYEWRDLHRDELIENWDRLREGRPPKPIEPLA
jgi:hypothetical protein